MSETVTAESSQDDIKSSDTTSSQPAVILYTGASTGVPMGVLFTRGGPLSQIFGTATTLNLKRETSPQHSPLGFDLLSSYHCVMAVQWWWWARNAPRFSAHGGAHGERICHDDAFCAIRVPKAKSWRYAMSGGEKLGQGVRRAFQKLDCSNLELVIVCGPAEIILTCALGIVPCCAVRFVDDDELDEISNAIVNISTGRIVNAAASLRPGQLSDMLIVFVVFDLAFAGDKVDFANRLRNSIPLGQAMMPSLIVPVERIPATANGKTDSVALNRLPIHDMANLKAEKETARSLSSMEQSKAIFGARCSLPICLVRGVCGQRPA